VLNARLDDVDAREDEMVGRCVERENWLNARVKDGRLEVGALLGIALVVVVIDLGMEVGLDVVEGWRRVVKALFGLQVSFIISILVCLREM
jgi:hypothetical protein